ncbi:MAG: hypothetical protein P1R58_00470 [bacterium]|nr:hypothetical protein [bacterium]
MKKTIFHIVILLTIFLTTLPGCGNAFEMAGQMVTWSDFNYIKYVSSSIYHAYFVTTDGIISYNKLEQRWDEPLTGSIGLDDRSIDKLWADKFGDKLYISTDRGYFEYDSFFEKWYSLIDLPDFQREFKHVTPPEMMFPPPGYLYDDRGILDDPISRKFEFSDVVDDLSGYLWIGTWGMGAARARTGEKRIELMPYGLIQNGVGTIYNDSGLLWIGGPLGFSTRSGLTRFDPDENEFDYVESGLDNFFPPADINCLAPYKNYMLIGSSRGLYYLNTESDRIEMHLDVSDKLADDNLLALVPFGDSVFVGTEYGLNLLVGEPPEISYVWPNEFLNRRVYDLELVGDDLWIAASNGAYRLNLVSGGLQRFQDPGNRLFGEIYDLELWENYLWFATNDLIMRLDLESGETEPYQLLTTSFRPRKIAANDRIAAVTADDGVTLFFLDRDPVFDRTFSIEDGLPSNTVYELELDGDFLWVGSDRGLTRFWWNNPNRVD